VTDLAPEPCDTGEPATTVQPLGWHDLNGQISDTELVLRRMDTVTVTLDDGKIL
jgi:hypothetical protein